MKRVVFLVIATILISGFYFYKQNQISSVENFNKAVEFMNSENYSSAIRLLEGAYSENMKEVRVLDALAYSYEQSGMLEKSIEYDRKLLAIDPENLQAKTRLEKNTK